MFTEISAQRFATVAQALPSGPYRLLMLWLALSKDGAQQIYPTADWCRRQLGVSESTYHRWRRWLEDHRLVAIVRRKVSREHNLPNLVRVMSLKQLSAWVWSRIRGLIRKGVTGGIRTPVPYIKKQQLAPKVQLRPLMQSEIARRYAFCERYGVSEAMLDAIPDARTVAKGLGKKGGTT